MNRQYQSQPNFQRQPFQSQPYQPFQPKDTGWPERNGPQFYRPFGYQSVYNSTFQNRQPNASAQPRQLTQRYPSSFDFKNLPERRQGYANAYDPKSQLFERRPFKVYDGNQQSRQQTPPNQFPIIFGNRQPPVKIEKAYQISVADENEEIDHFITDPVFYNAHHESSSNDEYDKGYDDYQSYGNEISDSIMGGTDVNFINPSTPLVKVKPKHTCGRCRKSFDFRNRFFAHLRLNCWSNIIKLDGEFTAMITDATSLPVITFSATAVESTGYVFKN